MAKLIKNVVERTFRFRRFRADGMATDTIIAIRAESEDAARLKIETIAAKPYDWRVESVED